MVVAVETLERTRTIMEVKTAPICSYIPPTLNSPVLGNKNILSSEEGVFHCPGRKVVVFSDPTQVQY